MSTGRARGKHGPRSPVASAAELEAIGGDIEDPGPNPRDIRGGRVHQVQKVLPQPTTPAVPATRSPYRDMMAHGVPPDGEHWDRPHPDDTKQIDRSQHHEVKRPTPPPNPVPVYIVEQADKGRNQVAIEVTRVTAPANTAAEPARIVSVDPNRSRLLLLNEDSTNAARIGKLVDLITDNSGKTLTGAKLPASMVNYLTIEGHDELFVISDAATAVVVSVIVETYVEPLV